jgi:hypothetical protein
VPPAGAGGGSNLRVVLIVLLVVFVVGAVGAVVAFRDSGGNPKPVAASGSATTSPGTSATSASSEPSASPSSTGVSPADYQRALSGLDTAVAPAFRRLVGARTPSKVTSALSALRAQVVRHTETLRGLEPPDLLATPHASLLDGLDTFASDLDDAMGSSRDWDVCAGPSATALLSRSAGAAAVRSAAAKIAATDPAHRYRVATFLPRKTADLKRRRDTGMLKRPGSRGLGQLEIRNGGTGDAAVSLVPVGGKAPLLSAYVRSKGSFTVTGIPDGNYTGYVTTGADWDPRNRGFSRSCNYFRFDDRFDFRTTSSQFTIWRIGLTPQAGGNAKTSGVDPDSFPG